MITNSTKLYSSHFLTTLQYNTNLSRPQHLCSRHGKLYQYITLIHLLNITISNEDFLISHLSIDITAKHKQRVIPGEESYYKWKETLPVEQKEAVLMPFSWPHAADCEKCCMDRD